MRHIQRSILLLICLTVLFSAFPVVAQKKKAVSRIIEGTISGFFCGHTCYLTIIDKKGKKYTKFCFTKLCDAWWSDGKMPARYKGRKVRVTVAKKRILLDEENAKPFTADAIIRIQFQNKRGRS